MFYHSLFLARQGYVLQIFAIKDISFIYNWPLDTCLDRVGKIDQYSRKTTGVMRRINSSSVSLVLDSL